MKNNKGLLKLTHIMIKAFYFIVLIVVILPPVVYKTKVFADEFLRCYMIPLYISLPAGVAALVCLDRLFGNLRKDIVFRADNVKYLNILSICCFIASAISLSSFAVIMCINFAQEGYWIIIVGGVLYILFFIMGIGEIFVGLIVRVVKNTFESAIVIKDENDLTI